MNRSVGVLLVIVGVLAVLGGAGMDTTKTVRSCYQSDYAGVNYDGSGCVETTYSDPAPKVVAFLFGFSAIVGGGALVYSGDDASRDRTSRERDASGGGGSETGLFVDQIRERSENAGTDERTRDDES